jgi:hypothetical protein
LEDFDGHGQWLAVLIDVTGEVEAAAIGLAIGHRLGS